MKYFAFLIPVLFLAAYITTAESAPRQSPFVTKVTRNNGDTRTAFVVAVTSSAWIQVLPTDSKRRFAVIHSSATTVPEVCLSTHNASAVTCTTATKGRHIPNMGISVEDYNEAILYARGVANAGVNNPTSVNLYGEIQYDSAD